MEAHQVQNNDLNFLDEPLEADATTDIIYMMCPMHLLTIEDQVKEIGLGQVLSILTDYDGALALKLRAFILQGEIKMT